MVTSQYDHGIGREPADKLNVLINSVSCPLVKACFRLKNAKVYRASARLVPVSQVTCHVGTLVISKDSDVADAGMEAVTESEVNYLEPAGERQGRLGSHMTEDIHTFTTSTSND
jgi:hypothetical protein